MIKIGQYNKMAIKKFVDFGAYLDGGDDLEILLPRKYVDKALREGDDVEVFVYTDSEDRLIATTQRPKAKVGEFAYLRVAQVNKVGAFLDWGITAKDLFVPFSEQKATMREGGEYLVYVYLDDTTKRIVATTKTEKYVGNVLPHYRKGEPAEALVIARTEIGYRCIVDNLHYGMLYDNELYQRVGVGDRLTVYVKKVRDDGKLDLSANDRADRRTSDLGEVIMERLRASGGTLHLSDKSSPSAIEREFACSKKDFKKAIGHLYKSQKIAIHPDRITLKEG